MVVPAAPSTAAPWSGEGEPFLKGAGYDRHVACLSWPVPSRVSIFFAILVVGVAMVAGQSVPRALPPKLADYVGQHVKLTAEQLAQLDLGQVVTRLLDADPSREVAIFGAVWIKAPVDRYLAAVKDIERLESGDSFRLTKRISNPPRLQDFDPLTLPAEDVSDLKTCRVGSCELKLGEAALTRLQKEIDWSKATAAADVERLFRTFALQYVNAYLEGGNERLAVYRDSDRPTFVAKEFASMIARVPSLTDYLPDLKRYLLGYPQVTLPDAESFLYWQDAKFGLKPTIRINHLTIVRQPPGAAVVSKMLYASHYFWTAIELRVLVPDPARGDGFWFVNVNRSRSDGLSGFTGRVIRGKVRGEVEQGMAAALRTTKAKLEAM
jgi:hypothetical protein